ncbi:Xyloside xylosyltransferase 1, partial [Stegodyphus mimosarum]
MLFFTHADHKPELKNKLALCISSMFKYATLHLHFHILTDNISLNSAMDVLKESAVLARTSAEVSFYDVNAFVEPLQELINTIRPLFSFKQGAYYSDGLFFISVGLFKIMLLKKLIIVDADVKFLDDIKELHDYFNKFPPEALIGAASEQQPVYRHVLHEYRRIYNDTLAGGPPPDGKTGFNSGVLLLDLEKMRHSDLYNEIVNNSSFVLHLVEKYKFKGHLGDQDFYSLINLEYPYLFYHLPCTWNRQLYQWWKYHGYKDVFDLYHSCSGKIHLLHGNCNTMIPDK